MFPPNKPSDATAGQNKTLLRGGSSISKMLARDHENLSLDSQHCIKGQVVLLGTCDPPYKADSKRGSLGLADQAA